MLDVVSEGIEEIIIDEQALMFLSLYRQIITNVHHVHQVGILKAVLLRAS